MIKRGEAGRNAIGQAAFFAHFGHQARAEAAGHDFHQNRRAKPIGVGGVDAGVAKDPLRLGNIFGLHIDLAGGARRCAGHWRQLPAGRQGAKQVVEDRRQTGRRDVPDR